MPIIETSEQNQARVNANPPTIAAPIPGQWGAVPRGGFGRGAPSCPPGYEFVGSQCRRTAQGQIQDIAISNLRGQGGTTTTPTTPAAVTPPAVPSTYKPPAVGGTTSTTTTTTGGARDRERMANPQLAGNAALLRAKDQQGQIAQSAVSGLRAALGQRGMLGSGAEAGATQGIAAQALGSISDVNREQQIQNNETQRQYDLADYQGRVSQRGQDVGESLGNASNATNLRGQDINAAVTQRGQDITARGQDISAQSAAGALQLQQQQAILNALRMATSLY